ncbi:MAG: NAD(P)H-dependent oxidoreductase [Erysipelotrichaceae bacterium]|nr:NAD(P)H-dependent oxidoreductase [Erysipelotrichaceae bacterium]
MRVLFIDGNGHKDSVLYKGIEKCRDCLNDEQIDSDVISLKEDIHPCTACGKCIKKRRCIFSDAVNEVIDHSDQYDAFIVASDVFFSEPDKKVIEFMNRLFRCGNERMAHKAGAVMLYARSNSYKNAYSMLNDYFYQADMPVITSSDCFCIHEDDDTDMETMHKLAQYMSWMLKSIEAGKEKGLIQPMDIPDKITDFTR